MGRVAGGGGGRGLRGRQRLLQGLRVHSELDGLRCWLSPQVVHPRLQSLLPSVEMHGCKDGERRLGKEYLCRCISD